MTFAVTPNCCNDASCVSVCPVNCIHPTPDEPEFGTTEMLYIDPAACIDCGACADACPVDAILPTEALTGADEQWAEANQRYYEQHPTEHAWGAPDFPQAVPAETGPLRIALVGTGPSAGYAARELLHTTDAELTLIDRLPVPGGLLRAGVAPDHPATKQIGAGFAELYRHPRVRLALNVEVGRDVSVAELAEHHSAVVYAVGAPTDRRLDVPGEDLANSHAATDVVGWYNAHPDRAQLPIDLSAERAVVVGTGNVALDIARILLSDPDTLARTDISDLALQALRSSSVREVVLLARRDSVAYTAGEFAALCALPGLEVVVDEPSAPIDYASSPPPGRRLVLRRNSPTESLEGADTVGADTVGAVVVGGPRPVRIPAGLVVRAIGHRGRALPGLPFDVASGSVPNEAGRVIDPTTGAPIPGAYVTGWIKRGPTGGIGTNRICAAETVAALKDDAARGVLPTPRRSARAFDRLLRSRVERVVDRRAATAIERAERSAGRRDGRPRVKFVTVEALLAAGRPGGLPERSRRLSRPSA